MAAGVAFVRVEHRTAHPMLPPGIFASPLFRVTNVVTFVVYAALGGIFFLLVLTLQTAVGFGPVLAGAALLPITVIMLALSSRAGELAERIGPRLPMTVGPALSAVGTLLLLRIDEDASYVSDVLPGVALFGLGLAATVAPLTTTVLAAAPDRHAGLASGVNNAVARTAGLLSVAALPGRGRAQRRLRRPRGRDRRLPPGRRWCAPACCVGSVVAAVRVRRPEPAGAPDASPCRRHCAVEAPPWQPADEPAVTR